MNTSVSARIERLAASVAMLTTAKAGHVIVVAEPWPIDEAALVGLSDVPGEPSEPQTLTPAALAALEASLPHQKAEVGAGDDGEVASAHPWAAATSSTPELAPASAPSHRRVRIAAVDPEAAPPPREPDHVEEFFRRMAMKHRGPGFTNEQ